MPAKLTKRSAKKPITSRKPIARLAGAPVARVSKTRNTAPRTTIGPAGSTIISHRELAFLVTGATGFKITPVAVNPGNSDLFPWLSSIAPNYEYYRFKKLKFEYKPSCPTTTPGAAMIAIDYDALDAPPDGIITLMQNQNAVKTSVWDAVTYDLVKAGNDAIPKRFVLDNLPPPGSDPRMYNLGTAYMATYGQTSTDYIGELYVQYVVELSVPQANGDERDQATLINTSNGDPLIQPFANAVVSQDRTHPLVTVTANPGNGNLDTIKLNRTGTFTLDISATADSAFDAAGTNYVFPLPYNGSGITISSNSTGPPSLAVGATVIGSWIIEYYPTLLQLANPLVGYILNYYSTAWAGKTQNGLRWTLSPRKPL